MPKTSKGGRDVTPQADHGLDPPSDLDFDDAVLRLATYVVAATITAGAENDPPLSATQVRVLVVLDGAPQGATLTQVASAVAASAPSASRLCQRLVTHGLVTRSRGPGNTITLRLSQTGSTTLKQVNASRLNRLRALRDALPAPLHPQVTAAVIALAQVVPAPPIASRVSEG